MQVQSINSSFNRVKFGLKNSEKETFVLRDMDDKQIKYLAAWKTAEEQPKRKNPLKSLLITLPLVDTVSKFIMKNGGTQSIIVNDFSSKVSTIVHEIIPGSLSQKMSAAGHTAMKWGGVLLVLGAYNSIKNAIVSRSEKLQNIESKHPVLSMFADIGLFLGSLSLAEKGANKVAEKILKKTPKLVETMGEKVFSAKKWLDKTYVNTKVLPKISKLVEKVGKKAPLLAIAGLMAVATAPYIVILNGLLKASNQNRKLNKDFWEKYNKNYRDLKAEQLQTKI